VGEIYDLVWDVAPSTVTAGLDPATQPNAPVQRTADSESVSVTESFFDRACGAFRWVAGSSPAMTAVWGQYGHSFRAYFARSN
jgi:hypothetical protein